MNQIIFFLFILLNSSPRIQYDPWKKPLNHAEDPSVLKYMQNNIGYWDGKKDETLLNHIQKSEIKSIGFNKGGSTISLRFIFKDGSSAAFKPEQFHEETVPRYEIAAYRISKLLGLSRVPPATWRIITRKELFKKLKNVSFSERRRIMREVNFGKDGSIKGEISYWIPVVSPVTLESIKWRSKWFNWLSPYDYLLKNQFIMAGQISNMILFDFIINNPDRFTGFNTMATPNKKYLYYMDNTFSFYPNNIGSGMARLYMMRVRRYSGQFIKNLKALSKKRILKEFAKVKNPPWKLLNDKEINAVIKRRDFLMSYIVKTIAQFGWGKCVVFP